MNTIVSCSLTLVMTSTYQLSRALLIPIPTVARNQCKKEAKNVWYIRTRFMIGERWTPFAPSFDVEVCKSSSLRHVFDRLYHNFGQPEQNDGQQFVFQKIFVWALLRFLYSNVRYNTMRKEKSRKKWFYQISQQSSQAHRETWTVSPVRN